MDNIFVLLKLFLGFQIIFCSQKREIVYILPEIDQKKKKLNFYGHRQLSVTILFKEAKKEKKFFHAWL